jgi:predicted RNA-binding Zn-ribbon protein involved in translation (DUF1610 family)
MMEQLRDIGGHTMDAITSRLWGDSKTYPSQRPCPTCGGTMVYRGSGLSAFTGKYSRTCQECGYTDPHKVTLVRQI